MSAVFHDYVPLSFRTTSPAALGGITTANADVAWVEVPYQCQIRRFAVINQDNNATGYTAKLDYQPTMGSATGRVTLFTMTIPASNQQGKYNWQDATSSTSTVVQEGGQLVLVTSAAAGVIKATALVERKPEVPTNLPNAVNYLS